MDFLPDCVGESVSVSSRKHRLSVKKRTIAFEIPSKITFLGPKIVNAALDDGLKRAFILAIFEANNARNVWVFLVAAQGIQKGDCDEK